MKLNNAFIIDSGWVLDAPGYPGELTVECAAPDGYTDQWSYGIWLKGRWSNLQSVTRCIDPNLCYNEPPALPVDFSVQWNQTTAKVNSVNTTLIYWCDRKCKTF